MGSRWCEYTWFPLPGYTGQLHILDGCRVGRSQPTVPVYEENGELKRGVLDMSANANLISWDPSSLGTQHELELSRCGSLVIAASVGSEFPATVSENKACYANISKKI